MNTPHIGRRIPKTPPALDAITDAVLAYCPKPKTKSAKRRVRKAKRKAKGSRFDKEQFWDRGIWE